MIFSFFFHQIIGICVNVNYPDLFSDYSRVDADFMRSFGKVAFENGLQYRHSDSKIFSGNILAILCANMMKIGPVTPENTRAINAPFWMRRQKSAYLIEYLTNYWTDLYQRFSVGISMYVDYKTCISFVVVQGTLL